MGTSQKKGLILVFHLLFLFSISLYSSDLIFSIAADENHPMYERIEQVIDLALSISGQSLSFHLESMNFDRAKYSLINGYTDGDLFRTKAAYADAAGVIPVEPPMIMSSVLLLKRREIELESISDLQNYRMLVMKGNVMTISYAVRNHLSYKTISDHFQAIRLLGLDRADFFIVTELERHVVPEEFLEEHQVDLYPEVVFSDNFYLFLSSENENLVSSFSEAFTKMAQDNSIERILLGQM